MPEHDYDEHYANLGLKPGASLQAIQTAWKEQAMLLHPDNFTAGPMKAASEKRLILVNIARDALREYWEKNNAPPPSNLRGAASASTNNQSQAPPPQPEKTWQEDAYEQWKKERQQQQAAEARARQQARSNSYSAPPPTPPPSPPKPRAPFGPPAPVKKPQHHIYDFLKASESTSSEVGGIAALIIAGLVFGGALFASTTVLSILGAILQIPPGFWMNNSLGMLLNIAGTSAILVPAFRTYLADYEIYEIENNPYVKPCSLRAQDVISKITKTLVDPSAFAGQPWTLKNTTYNTQTETYANDYVYKFPLGEAELNTRVIAASANTSMVTYWFTVNNIPLWRTPIAKLIRKTDTALWKALK